MKHYPDFIVASYYGDKEWHDKVHLVFKIGSLHNREALMKTTKKNIQNQLHDYMVLLQQG